MPRATKYHFILSGEGSTKGQAFVKNCLAREKMGAACGRAQVVQIVIAQSLGYCGCAGVNDGKSLRGETEGTLGIRVTWPLAASSMLMPAWSSVVPTARSSSTRDFS